MIIVSDTSVVSNFFLINSLHILQKTYKNLIIPQKVYFELKDLALFGHDITWLDDKSWIEVKTVSNPNLITPLLSEMDEGEAEAIILSQEIQVDYLLIDDLKGRQYAQRIGLQIVGSVGTLIKAKSLGYISNIKSYLDQLIFTAKAYISLTLYNEVLKLANEKN